MTHSSIPMSLLLCIVFCGLTEAEPMDELSKAHDAFAVDLYKKIGDANTGKNLFFSPISISIAFGMVNLGAKGETRNQTKAVLHLDEIRSDEVMKKAYKQLLATLPSKTNGLHLVNRLFGSNSYDFHQKYLQGVKNNFKASLQSLDFIGKPEESRHHINQWVERQTNKKIKNIIPEGIINKDTILIIVNAIHFKARWLLPFNDRSTKPGPFSISKSNKENVDMMHLYKRFLNYHSSKELRCEVLEMPYRGDSASMFVFLPRDVEGLPSLEKQLTGKILADTLSKVRRQNMIVQLPKFVIDQGISLKQFLQAMGMVDVFDIERSDLSGIGGPKGLFVSDAIHKAFVNVSEIGTEAAAATGHLIRLSSVPPPPIRFIVDRPFLFLIYEKKTKSVVFMGRLVRPPTAKN